MDLAALHNRIPDLHIRMAYRSIRRLKSILHRRSERARQGFKELRAARYAESCVHIPQPFSDSSSARAR
jgi:hypothetical protein